VVLWDAIDHRSTEGLVGVVARFVDLVDERRALDRPGALDAVADRTVVVEQLLAAGEVDAFLRRPWTPWQTAQLLSNSCSPRARSTPSSDGADPSQPPKPSATARAATATITPIP